MIKTDFQFEDIYKESKLTNLSYKALADSHFLLIIHTFLRRLNTSYENMATYFEKEF